MTRLQLIIGSFGIIQSFFMCLYIFIGKKSHTTNYLISLMFFLIGIRLAKSMLWLYGENISEVILNVGFIAHMATAPTLFLYFLMNLKKNQFKKQYFFHFSPAILLLLFITELSLNRFWYKGGYTFLLIYQMVYMLATLAILIYYIRRDSHSNKELSKRFKFWLIILFLGVSSIQIVYFFNYIFGVINYAVAPQIYALFIFVIALFGAINHKIFDITIKYSNINLSSNELVDLKVKVENFMNNEKPYLSDRVSLKTIASNLGMNSYIISYVINQGFGLNFTDYINSYRITEVKERLMDSSYNNIKISEIAYECGFNTLSAFNGYFRKKVGMTPSEFRKNSSKVS